MSCVLAAVTTVSGTPAMAATQPGPAAAPAACPRVVASLTSADVDRVWDAALPRLRALTGPTTYPFGRTADDRYLRTGPQAWTSGFFPTSLWLAFARTHDPVWRASARRYTAALLRIARWRGTHDLGFMVGLPIGLARALDPDRARRYDHALAAAAHSLSTRWNGRVGALRSATYSGRWGLIVDSAMNAPLLVEQGRTIGGAAGERLSTRGVRHLLTLARDFVREDGSTVHRQAYDPRTGRLLGPLSGQGAGPASTWARGQAWAITGFARGYGLTGDARLLAVARVTADYWMTRIPAGCVPSWDLTRTGPHALRDSSAAAIAAFGLLLLGDVEPDPARAALATDHALRTLRTLASAPWLAASGPGVLARQAYNIPADPREGTYVWGDAYLLAALTAAVGRIG